MNSNLTTPEGPRSAGPLRVLIADDEPPLRVMLQSGLRAAGYAAVLAHNGREAMAQADQDIFCALIDWQMPGADGFEVLRFLKAKRPELPVIMMSARGHIPEAVRAVQAGALEFIPKPLDLPRLLALMQSLPRKDPALAVKPALPSPVPAPEFPATFLGDSPAARQLRENIRKVAQLNVPILLTGESGVGKGLVARLIHEQSARARRPFVVTSCPALSPELFESELFGHERGAFSGAVQRRLGRFEAADGGTLFLDEISQLPLPLQPKLLNVLQDRIYQRVGSSTSLTTDIRLITATNEDLEEKVARQGFRLDLLFRINVIDLNIPPLRERRPDILPLAESVLAQWAVSQGGASLALADASRALLEAYSWPGNVRELQNVLLRAAAFCERDQLEPEDFPEKLRRTKPGDHLAEPQVGGLSADKVDEISLRQTLALCGGNKSSTAKKLGLTEKTVYNRMDRYGLR